ncbi:MULTISPECIES: protein-L-isoaspartate O-methyltransferase family protein [Metallosphaera]|uniref:protein-L-isoaspartate(D-aspartate) O-methyltransferase n=4 Tax=Metallosphaera TaxID=41980 RepID=A4YIQ0_METS5|nr:MULTISPECIES: protein-L-isoaspartate O-methyltransferase [Metallosphaera]ABP96302.1 protein-L-isoaspartate(D-aspartate) O-methyltransferase [Metallosphaera sedula DSM 5348]AIM28285.1 protein-L-isoaspartate(D-aspartate) O-methyltransferase [Metallosphaera sedula]MCY0861038.1 protein-L-isoaspartate O-methyltransferase [Metallosphaera prunae]QCO30317.1 protein-L-isoaspartate O-methyltransferase [Metallosphaera prunae]WPX06120.1 protein-L-isoaspartate O-methyltransferase [Metallosphaera sedula 
MRRIDQLILSMVSDESLRNAYLKVDRAKFLPESSAKFAYDPEFADKPIPITDKVNTTALTLGIKMLDYLGLKRGDKVLEVGTGCGYYTALIAEIVGPENVTTIEVDPWIARYAEERLQDLGIKVQIGDGTLGFPGNSPYDKAVIWVALPTLPCLIYQQLVNGGVLLAPIGTQKTQNLFRVFKADPPRVDKLDSVIFMKAQGLCGFYD